MGVFIIHHAMFCSIEFRDYVIRCCVAAAYCSLVVSRMFVVLSALQLNSGSDIPLQVIQIVVFWILLHYHCLHILNTEIVSTQNLIIIIL